MKSLKILSKPWLLATLALTAVHQAHGQVVSNWTYTGSSGSFLLWSSVDSWSNGVPDAAGDTANFIANRSGSQFIQLNGNRTVGTMAIDDSGSPYNSYIFTTGNDTNSRLIFDATSGSANLNSATPANTVSNSIVVPVTLNDPLSINWDKTTLGSIELYEPITDGAASYSITKSGNGIANFVVANTYDGGTFITGGRITAGVAGSFGTGSVTVGSGGQAFLASSGNYSNAFNLAGIGYNLVADSAASLGALRYSLDAVTSNTITLTGPARIGASGATTVGTMAGPLIGTDSLEINSPAVGHDGTIVLNGNASAMTGTITVKKGHLILGSGSNPGGSLVVDDDARLSGETNLVGDLTLGASTGSTLTFDPSTSAKLTVGGNLTLNGVTSVVIDPKPFAGSSLPILSYTGSLTGGLGNLALGGGNFRPGTTFVHDPGPKLISLTVASKNLVWTGGDWNYTDQNWTEGVIPNNFFDLDGVTFNVAGSVSIDSGLEVRPSSATFDMPLGDNFQLSGPGTFTNSAIVKRGTGTLTIGDPISYTAFSNLVTGSSSILVEKGNLAFSSHNTLVTNTPITLGSTTSGSDATVLEIPRADIDNRIVLEPIITLGTLSPGASSEAILRYTGLSAGSNISGGAPQLKGTVNLNGRNLYLENTSNLTGDTARRASIHAAITGTGDVRVRAGSNPDGSFNAAARVRLNPTTAGGDASINTWNGHLFVDAGYLQLGNKGLSDENTTVPDTALVTLAAGTGVVFSNGGETIRGLVGGAATGSVPFPAIVECITASATLSSRPILTLTDDNASNTHVFHGNLRAAQQEQNGDHTFLILTKNGAATQVLTGDNWLPVTTSINGGTLEIGGAGTFSTGAPGNSDGLFFIAAGATLKFNSTADQLIRGLTADGGNSQRISGAGALIKDNTGTLTLSSGLNSHTGVTTLTGGTLSVSSIGNGGEVSSLGAATSAASNLIFDGGTLRYIGATATSNRAFTINSGKTATIDTPNLTNSISVAGATGAASTGALTKTGLGNLTLTAINTYTGPTLVSAGQLTVEGDGALPATSSLSVSDGAAISYQPNTIGTALTLGSGSTLSMANGSILRLAWNGSTANRISPQGAASVGTGVGVLIDMGSDSFFPGTAYTILTAASGLNTGTYRFFNLVDYTVAVAKTPTSVIITPTLAPPLTGAYWRGTATLGLTQLWAATNGSSESNWASSAGGPVQALVPGAAADVFIANSPVPAATSTMLGANMTIKSLTIADTTNGLGLDDDGNTLTLTNGILMNSGVPASYIAADVAFGSDQTWTNNSTNALTVSGNISGTFGLTKDGSGPLIFTGANTYSGDTNVDAGTLQIAAGSLNNGSYGGFISLGSGASLRYSSSLNQDLFGRITGLGSLVKDTFSTNTLTLSDGSNSFGGGITVSAGRVSAASPGPLSTGTITCIGNASGGGQLYVTGTTLATIPNNFILSGVGFAEPGINPLRAGAIRAAENQTYSGTLTLAGDARFGVIGATVSNTLSGKITGNFAMEFFGGLSNSAAQTFVLANPGPANDYSGNTSITSVDFLTTSNPIGSTVLQLGAPEQIPHGPGKGNLIFNGSDTTNLAIFDLFGFNETLNGIVNIADSGAIQNTGLPATLTIGAADTSSSFSGGISDSSFSSALALTKIGIGTLTLTGANTFQGNIILSGGKLSATKMGLSASTRTITVASGAVLEFGTGNVFGTGSLATIHRTTAVPAITVNGGTITNSELLLTNPDLIRVNNALRNVTLNSGTLTATVGNGNATDIRPGEGYGAWGLNGTVTSTGTSLIDTTAVPGKAGHVLLSSSTVDTTFNVTDGTLTIASVLQRGDSAAGNRGLIKSGGGILSLTAANIYTGNTAVNAGTLALADNAQLKFVLGATSGSNNTLTGAGTVTLNGDFNIDTTAADALASGTWTLENVSTLTGAYGASFTVIGFNDIGGNKWTKTVGSKLYTFDETTGILTLASGSAYDTWANAKGLTGLAGSSTDPAKTADPDKDGRNNLAEFALDGNPLSGANDGKVVGKVAAVSSAQTMTLTLPVRNGATFGDSSGDELSTLIDGIYYRIEGGTDLVTFADNITEVPVGLELTAIQAGLPLPLSTGWSYRTFRVSGTVPTAPKAFLRAKISETP